MASVLATLSGTCAYAGGSEYGTWNDTSFFNGAGSQTKNNQVTLQTQWSNLNGSIDTVAGDAVVMGAAGGNLMDITTMNDTAVDSSQYVGFSAAIGSNIGATINNIGGSVGIQNQAVCNGLSVSTDPILTAVRNNQECHASDPSSQINANVTNVYGDAVFQGSALGNTFQADSNAPNMPIFNRQINNSVGASTINASVYNIGGSTSLTSSAIGNTGQIIHYNTN